MSYINKEDLLATINEVWERKYGRCHYQPLSDVYRMIIRRINGAPVVNAVDVVRCKDCKYSYIGRDDKLKCDILYPSLSWVDNDGYCNYGERRED